MRLRHFCWLSGLAFSLLAGSVRGDTLPAPAASDALTDQARELHLKGVDLFAKNDVEKAHAAFLAAWGIKKHFQIASNLGACEVRLGKHRDAAEHLSFYLREAPKDADPAARKLVLELLETAKKKVGTVEVKVTEPGAEVKVDGMSAGTSPMPGALFVEPGAHKLAAQKGQASAEEEVLLEAGTSRTVVLTLRLPDVGAEQRGIAPLIGLGAGGVVTAGVGIGLLVAWSERRSQVAAVSASIQSSGGSCVTGAANFDARCPALESDSRGAVPLSRAGVGMLIGAAALGGAAAAYWLWPRSPNARAGATALPMASPEGAGVIVVGTF